MLVIVLIILFREALLKNRSFSFPSLFQGCSSSQGTSLGGRSDADLVVFLGPLPSFREQFAHRSDSSRKSRKQLRACQKEKGFTVYFEIPNNENPRSLGFKLRSRCLQKEVEFDVLPAYAVLGQGPHTSHFSLCPVPKGFFSPSPHTSDQKSCTV